ncbi:MAG: hypothetical protein WCI39_01995 [Gallionellaceae bacterium]
MRTRPRYIMLIEAEPGMVLDAKAHVVDHGILRFSLPAGHTLTADNIRQLTSLRAEYIFIAEPDERTDEQVAIDAAHEAHRVMEIFSGADLSDLTMAKLFNQAILYRSA